MQFHAEADDGRVPRPGEPGADGVAVTVTRLVDDACIFLNRPGFAGGAGCALHIAALEAGERPLDWKPNVCWQVPLRLEHSTDENGHVTSRLRDWKRRDWGDGGADFHWWCTESPEAFVGDEPVYLTIARRDRRARRRADLRPAGRGPRAPGLDRRCRTRPLRRRRPGVARWDGLVVRQSSSSSSSNSTPYFSAKAAYSSSSVVTGGRWPVAPIAEPQVERPGTGLLQLARLFEAAMTTLLHAGLPQTSELTLVAFYRVARRGRHRRERAWSGRAAPGLSSAPTRPTRPAASMSRSPPWPSNVSPAVPATSRAMPSPISWARHPCRSRASRRR